MINVNQLHCIENTNFEYQLVKLNSVRLILIENLFYQIVGHVSSLRKNLFFIVKTFFQLETTGQLFIFGKNFRFFV
jgi:hypothetical protein